MRRIHNTTIQLGIVALVTSVLFGVLATGVYAQTLNPHTSPAYSVTQNSATLLGSVAPVSGEGVRVWFEYSSTPSFQSPSRTSTRTYTTAVNVSETISNLASGTQYYYRLVAETPSGSRAFGETRSLHTKAVEQGTLLHPRTLPPESVSQTSVRLRGEVDPQGSVGVRRWFQWGIGTGRGNTTPTVNRDFEDDTFTYTLTGLQPNSAYSYRAVVENADGRRFVGDTRSFTPNILAGGGYQPPSGSSGGSSAYVDAITLTGRNVTRNSVTLRGQVNLSQSVSTRVHFEYGTTPNLGETTTSQTVSGYTQSTVSHELTGLSEGTPYFYRVVAENQFGSDQGEVLVIRTAGESSTPSPTPSPTPTPSPEPTPEPKPEPKPDGCPAGCVPEGQEGQSATSTNGLGAALIGAGFLPDTLIGWLIILLLLLLIATLVHRLFGERRKRKEEEKKAGEAQKKQARTAHAQDAWSPLRKNSDFRLPGQ